MPNVLILLAAIAVALAIGFALRARSGRVRAVAAPPSAGGQLLRDAGISATGPTILHFSATWCGPCAAVRRVVANTTATLADEGRTVLDLELDIDENPSLARELKVLSLPTTFLYDESGTLHHRIPGVPQANALLSAMRQIPQP
ncbi:thioredoxin family protein [Tomitella biformata]|uniref:thioredoxin family protein n=1 Tax=Tomitella biformata TaxID=630403 RepID=UPI0004674909|nr:thioredoxin family protein [Tomitella biformata]